LLSSLWSLPSLFFGTELPPIIKGFFFRVT
jgi:hypothetical protein